MSGFIPLIRVNYTFSDLFKAFFVSERSHRYRNELIEIIKYYFGAEDAALTSSCRTSLYLLLKNLPQNKMVIPAYTCGVVAEAAQMAGKKIVYAHVDKDSLNTIIYPEIDKETIVLATHQYGIPAPMEQIAEDCNRAGAILIEDCAGSFGSTINGKPTGTFGDFAVFSLSASKTIISPTKGGFIISKHKDSLSKFNINVSRNQQVGFKIKHLIKAFLFCLNNTAFFCKIFSSIRNDKISLQKRSDKIKIPNDNIYDMPFFEWQAFVVRNQFHELYKIFERRKLISKQYFKGINNPLISKSVFNSEAVNIRYPIFIDDRERLINDAKSKGIQLGKGYETAYYPDSFKDAEEIDSRIVYLPIGYDYSDKEIQYVIDYLNQYGNNSK